MLFTNCNQLKEVNKDQEQQFLNEMGIKILILNRLFYTILNFVDRYCSFKYQVFSVFEITNSLVSEIKKGYWVPNNAFLILPLVFFQVLEVPFLLFFRPQMMIKTNKLLNQITVFVCLHVSFSIFFLISVVQLSF